MARAERWTPHVEDGLDAFARVIHEAEAEKWASLIAEAGRNPAFRQQLAANPAEAVRDFGIAMPSGLDLRLVENTEAVRYLVLPAPAAGANRQISRLLNRLALPCKACQVDFSPNILMSTTTWFFAVRASSFMRRPSSVQLRSSMMQAVRIP